MPFKESVVPHLVPQFGADQLFLKYKYFCKFEDEEVLYAEGDVQFGFEGGIKEDARENYDTDLDAAWEENTVTLELQDLKEKYVG